MMYNLTVSDRKYAKLSNEIQQQARSCRFPRRCDQIFDLWKKAKMGGGGRTIVISAIIFVIFAVALITLAVVLSEEAQGLPDPEHIILNEANGDAILSTLRHLTSVPHTAGTEADKQQAQWVAQQWREQGLDTVHLTPYNVLLSYPHPDIVNTVSVVDDTGEEQWVSHGRQTPLWPGEDHPDVLPNFNAYSAPGNVQGDVVYAHYGLEEDFKILAEKNVSVDGCIILIRYGSMFRANQVKNAEDRGAIGVLLYLDPIAVSPEGQDPKATYPNTVYAPPDAVELGTTYLHNGDPLTPFYPSIDSAFRIPEKEASIPKIPVQPISYADASYIFQQLGGEVAPDAWQGGIPLQYRLGPGLNKSGWTTHLNVSTHNANATIYNVIGTIRGAVEPDRYVLVGNHRDAWIFGGVDPSAGTASMLEVSRLFGLLLKDGWRPRRTLVFCSWDAEEYGIVGSQEWTEQFSTHLKDRAVAYLNVDTIFEDRYSLIAMASPLMRGVVTKATQKVPNPDPEEVTAGRPFLYDTWVFRHPDPLHPDRPKILGLGGGSDFAGFQHILGIPCMDIYYTAEPDTPALPLYHTLHETFHLDSELYDPGMHYHVALTQAWALAALQLVQEQLIPFTVEEYGDFLLASFGSFEKEYGSLLEEGNVTLEYFEEAVLVFASATKNWTSQLSAIDMTNPLAVRAANDAQMLVERSFLDPQGLPGRPWFNHVVTAPSSSNNYVSDSWAGLQDLLHDILELPDPEQEKRWRQVKEHLAAVTHLTLAAANVLSYELW